MNEDKNIYEEIMIDGKLEKIVIELNDESIEDNNDFLFLDDTIELIETIREVTNE